MASEKTEKQKQSLYFPEDMLREIMAESTRLDRSLSWTVQQAWRLARGEVRKFPGVEQRTSEPTRLRDGDDPSRATRERGPSAQVLEFLKGKFERELAG